MNKKIFHIFYALLLATMILSACSGGGSKHLPGEPTGGNWTPVLLASSDAIRLPAPSDDKSAQQAEIDELLAFQNQRTDDTQTAVAFWNAGASLRWNEIARDLVAKNRTSANAASRVYALLSVAQYDALVAAWNNKYFHNRSTPGTVASSLDPLVETYADPAYPSEHATIAAVSSAVLTYLYPDEAEFLEAMAKEHQESRLWAGVNFRSDITAGDSLGREVAQLVIDYAQTDRSDAKWTGEIPTGEGVWFSDTGDEAKLSDWGQVRPWLMTSNDQFRSPPPPTYGSPEFLAALAEVKQISETRTQEQARLAALWADSTGSYTPSGRWNKVAADLIVQYQLNEIRAARVLALTNMAMMDAGIANYETKVSYWFIRPWQADPDIHPVVDLPNSPSYTSTHAAWSSAGAEMLGYFFPDEKESLKAKAEEAAVSRIYESIHYRFDIEAGLAQGWTVAQLAIERGRSDGSP